VVVEGRVATRRQESRKEAKVRPVATVVVEPLKFY
jgi:hypothetical protein